MKRRPLASFGPPLARRRAAAGDGCSCWSRTLAAGMVWQQHRAIQVEAAERARTQSAWILNRRARLGAPDPARGRAHRRPRRPRRALGRAAGRGAPVDLPGADRTRTTMPKRRPRCLPVGPITDAQSRYNLRNLIGADDKVVESELLALAAACAKPPTPQPTPPMRIAEGAAPGLGDRRDPGRHGADRAAHGGRSWPGSASIRPRSSGSRPSSSLLPVPTRGQRQHRAAEVIAAVSHGLGRAAPRRRIVQAPHAIAVQEHARLRSNCAPPQAAQQGLRHPSRNFFEVRGHLRLDDRVLEERSLVERRGIDVVTILRERVSSVLVDR